MKNNYLKTIILSIALASGAYLQAQQTTGAIAKQTSTVSGSVKLIDNKGTIKYLQAANGLTSLTNESGNDRTTTTWQLGGTLTDNTYIDVDGNTFGLDGLALINSTTVTASTNAASGTAHTDANAGSGWTLLVRDEATGAIQKLLATDMIQSGSHSFTISNIQPNIISMDEIVNGISTNVRQVWVYRNGAKLIADTDYTVNTNMVTLTPGNNNYPIYNGDVFEVQWIK